MANQSKHVQSTLVPHDDNIPRDVIFTEGDFRRAKHSARYEILDITGMPQDEACQEIFVLAYDCILAIQDVRTRQERLKRTIVKKGLVSPEAIIDQRDVLNDILRGAHRGKSKAEYIINLSRYWLNSSVNGMSIDERIIADINNGRNHANELKKEIAENVKGMKEKTTNYFFTRLGYRDMRVLDVHITRFVKDYGIELGHDTSDIDSRAGLHGRQYEKAANILLDISRQCDINPDFLSLLVWNSRSPYADKFIALMEQTGIHGMPQFEYPERPNRETIQSSLSNYISQSRIAHDI